jgi:hypothetical protein
MDEITLEHVENLVSQLSVEDQRMLTEHLTAKFQNGSAKGEPERKPQDLYGIWKGAFPEELNLDAALYEIRHEWEKEFEEFGL